MQKFITASGAYEESPMVLVDDTFHSLTSVNMIPGQMKTFDKDTFSSSGMWMTIGGPNTPVKHQMYLDNKNASVVYGSVGDAIHLKNNQKSITIIAREDPDFTLVPPLTIDNCYAEGKIEQMFQEFSQKD